VTQPVKLAIVYYSSTSTVDAMARRAAEAGERAGAEVRLRQVAETAPDEAVDSQDEWRRHVERTRDEPKAAPDDVVWADAVLLGSPTRFGNVASQLQAFLDTLGPQWAEGLLADKTYAGFTAAQTVHGGHEATLQSLYTTVQHFGGILVSPGYTDEVKFVDGNPYGVSHATGPDNDDDLGKPEHDALDHLVERIVTVTGQLLRGRASG
jgi:NAD(P)H dehydrogenase (quinone)